MQDPPVSSGYPDIPAIERLLLQAYAEGARAVRSPPPNAPKAADLVMVILPTRDTLLYGEVKRITDCNIGRPSQCIVSKNVGRPSKQYCANVCLKINVKMGGVNSSLGSQLPYVSDVPTIVFGADVTHPSAGDTNRRSIASVVASVDSQMSRYASKVRVQANTQELISDLQDIVKNHLITFYQMNNVKPRRIIFFRDGVGEGQFSHIMNTEVSAIRKACQSLEASYTPKITFIVVQKRHHVRFMPINRSQSDRSGNCLAGTVVDTTITNPLYRDFYLLSHSGIQGTSRPAHYHILVDENKMTSDDIEALTYRLCYTYARCTRSVSVSPPAYYAHLAAFRSRLHFKTDDATSFQSTDSQQGVYTGVAPVLERAMYFC